ncbi:MAG: hypothetical protein WA851_13765 [Xanthobacteraceae bacterium]
MKQAEASDFEVKVLEGGVNVTFKPTFSYYWFDRLIRPFDMIERLGPISSSATVRHMSWAGNMGDYNADEIAIKAYQLASEAAIKACGRSDEPEAKKDRPRPEAEKPATTVGGPISATRRID